MGARGYIAVRLAPHREHGKVAPPSPHTGWDDGNVGLFGLWLSLVERSVRVGEVQGSNPCSPMSSPPSAAFREPRFASQPRPDGNLCPISKNGGFTNSSKSAFSIYNPATRLVSCGGVSFSP